MPIVKVHCHKMIRAVAIEMAGELYDLTMRDNDKFAYWKAMCPELTPQIMEAEFIALLWPKLIETARTTLAQLLAQPIAESLKAEIHSALIRDNALSRGRMRAAQAQAQVMPQQTKH